MNMNGKLEGEDEQQLQYVNRFAINIPTGATAFNLNIVNPGLSNQSYILNPVSPVGQNIVAHQSPMALQSYIALPTEGEGNIIHSLPVGVPVPVGFPVPTGLLQNHNFVNTSIIIGNEDCNTPGVIKPSPNINTGSDIISYIDKPVEELTSSANAIEVQSIGLNCPTSIHTENLNKKPCPLEMSIKAANIDIEFEKPELEVPILLENVEKHPLLIGSLSLGKELKENEMKVPLEIPLVQTQNEVDVKKMKTEITWEGGNTKNEVVKNDFQETLICEVEEANEDEEEEDEEDNSGTDESDGGSDDVRNGQTTKESSSESSSEESDSLPLSVALKLKQDSKSRTAKGWSNEEEATGRRKRERKTTTDGDSEGHWSESDDDILNLKRIKNEFNYKCFYEPNTTKSATSLVLKLDDESKKFVRVRGCCSKRECAKKISVQDQKTAHRNFYELESNAKRDTYLINCIEHVQKSKTPEKENAKEKKEEGNLLENTNIQLEIENESNGNQKLSDEIQNAINESLKEFIGSESREEETKPRGEEKQEEVVQEKGEKNHWNFYIIIDRCRRKVCLQFLLKLFRITKSRIKHLQKRILSGTSSGEDSSRNQKSSEIWDMARLHLDGLLGEECLECNANPRHRFLTETRTREDLFINFREYYLNRLGKEPNIKYNSYKRFLDKESSLSFALRKEGICAECEDIKKNQKRKQKKVEKGSGKGKKSSKERKWAVKTESEEELSEDEPLLKRKKLKLTIPLKGANNKNQTKRNNKSNSHKGKSKEKTTGRQSGSRGRDVWSLMLLHLETMPYKEVSSCVSKKRHRFLDSSFTTQGLFEDYRKYFLKETNSELGLGFTMYEKYFNRNCNYIICDVNGDVGTCPGCARDGRKS